MLTIVNGVAPWPSLPRLSARSWSYQKPMASIPFQFLLGLTGAYNFMLVAMLVAASGLWRDALIVTGSAALLGIALGLGGSLAIGQFAGWRTSLSAASVVLAVGFAAAIGIFFGFYPAFRASKLDPIEALRHE